MDPDVGTNHERSQKNDYRNADPYLPLIGLAIDEADVDHSSDDRHEPHDENSGRWAVGGRLVHRGPERPKEKQPGGTCHRVASAGTDLRKPTRRLRRLYRLVVL